MSRSHKIRKNTDEPKRTIPYQRQKLRMQELELEYS